MRRIITLIIIELWAILGFAAGPLSVQTDLEGVLKLAKYASWPSGATELRIMMAAQSPESFKTAETYLNNNNFNDLPIKLEPYQPNSPLDGIMIIYIEENSGIDIDELAKKANNKQILTITNEYKNLELGCMFYINNTPDMLDYKYNKQAVINSGLMIKGSVLSPYHCME